MTASSNDNATNSPASEKKPGCIWGGCSRFLLLAVGMGVAGTVGIAIATVYPHPRPPRPWVATLLQGAGSLVGRGLPLPNDGDTATSSQNSQPLADRSPLTTTLTPAQADALREQLQQLQTDLKQLRDRTTALEVELGEKSSRGPLEQRLQILSQQLNLSSVGEGEGDDLAQPIATNLDNQGEEPMITLPSDVLFADHGSALQPQAKNLLNQLVADLEPYRGAKIRIAGHTDNDGNVAANRDISFNQAQAVQQYLTEVLGEKYRWVVVGYGETRPLVSNTSEANRQRNRRLEIVID